MPSSIGKIRVCEIVQNSGGGYLYTCTMDIFRLTCTEFYEKKSDEKIFWFGGHFGELESPKVWHMAEIFTFGG